MKQKALSAWMCWGLDLLYPRKCPFCQQILSEPNEPLCQECQTKLPWLLGQEAERKVEFAENCFSPLRYRNMVPDAIHRYKFGRKRSYGAKFALLLAQCIQDQHLPKLDCVTWAPLSRKRLRERGFDQAELLARETARQLELPLMPTVRKVRHTTPQSGLNNGAARRANALGAYEVLPEVELQGKTVLLVDDVVTSGATLGECARLLRQEGAQVYCGTVAQARSEA